MAKSKSFLQKLLQKKNLLVLLLLLGLLTVLVLLLIHGSKAAGGLLHNLLGTSAADPDPTDPTYKCCDVEAACNPDKDGIRQTCCSDKNSKYTCMGANKDLCCGEETNICETGFTDETLKCCDDTKHACYPKTESLN